MILLSLVTLRIFSSPNNLITARLPSVGTNRSKGIVDIKSIQNLPFKYKIAISLGSVTSSPPELSI
jgi:hypothetical protein